jgi:hypothetical protein
VIHLSLAHTLDRPVERLVCIHRSVGTRWAVASPRLAHRAAVERPSMDDSGRSRRTSRRTSAMRAARARRDDGGGARPFIHSSSPVAHTKCPVSVFLSDILLAVFLSDILLPTQY